MNKKLVKINCFLIRLLLISQPFIVMFQATISRDIQILGISLFESFNILLAVASTCLTIYLYQNKKVFLKYIPYVLALGVYLVAHGLHIYTFEHSLYTAQTPSFFVETYYILRTFIVPLLLLFNIYYSQMEKEKLIKTLEVFLFVVTCVMVLTNLLHVAQRNYAEVVAYNEYSLFDWFTFENEGRRSYYQLTTKGWFLSGNQMSAVLFLTFPITIYRAHTKRDWFHYLSMGLQMLAMFMLGTKVANAGSLLLLAVFAVIWLCFKVLKHKEKHIFVILAIGLGFAMLFPFSPIGQMMRYSQGNPASSSGGSMLDGALSVDTSDETDEEMIRYYENLRKDSLIFKELNPDALTLEQKEFVIDYMYDYCGHFGISPYIIENYDNIEHSNFWVHYIQETPSNDYRVLKTIILNDIYSKNDNSADKYLGLGYTLNYIYTESDYSYQFYNYGIVGMVLLICPYFVMLLYIVIQGLRHFKKMFTLECAMYAIAPVLGLVVAKFSGHVLERQLPLLMIATTLGIILIHTRIYVNEQ